MLALVNKFSERENWMARTHVSKDEGMLTCNTCIDFILIACGEKYTAAVPEDREEIDAWVWRILANLVAFARVVTVNAEPATSALAAVVPSRAWLYPISFAPVLSRVSGTMTNTATAVNLPTELQRAPTLGALVRLLEVAVGSYNVSCECMFVFVKRSI
jgi:hypothetical protein